MYKVFFNDRIVLIDDCVNKSIGSGESLIFLNPSSAVVENELVKFLKCDNTNDIQFISADVDAIFSVFCALFLRIDAAGGLVFNKLNQLLAIYRLARWDLPKGKIEKGESPKIAALREVQEECGISGMRIQKELKATYHIYRSPFETKKWVLKRTFWFEMIYEGNETLTPQTEEAILDVKWISENEIKMIYDNTYKSLKDVIRQYLP